MIPADWLIVTLLLNACILIAPVYFIRNWIALTVYAACLRWYLGWVPSESARFRGFPLWSWVREHYFCITVTDTRNTLGRDAPVQLVAIHPHGLYPVALDFHFACNQEMARYKPVATSLLFRVPMLKECAGWCGAIEATRETMIDALQKGHSLVMAPAGVADVIDRDVIATRKGFIRVAIQVGIPIVPVWSEGERDLYDVWLPAPRLQRWLLRTIRVPIGFMSRGLWWLPFWPKRRKLSLAVGKRLHPLDYGNDVDALHTAYLRELKTLARLKP